VRERKPLGTSNADAAEDPVVFRDVAMLYPSFKNDGGLDGKSAASPSPRQTCDDVLLLLSVLDHVGHRESRQEDDIIVPKQVRRHTMVKVGDHTVHLGTQVVPSPRRFPEDLLLVVVPFLWVLLLLLLETSQVVIEAENPVLHGEETIPHPLTKEDEAPRRIWVVSNQEEHNT